MYQLLAPHFTAAAAAVRTMWLIATSVLPVCAQDTQTDVAQANGGGGGGGGGGELVGHLHQQTTCMTDKQLQLSQMMELERATPDGACKSVNALHQVTHWRPTSL